MAAGDAHKDSKMEYSLKIIPSNSDGKVVIWSGNSLLPRVISTHARATRAGVSTLSCFYSSTVANAFGVSHSDTFVTLSPAPFSLLNISPASNSAVGGKSIRSFKN